jgi:hypothetical protein
VASLYRGLALRRLGQNEAAEQMLSPLSRVKIGEKRDAAEFYAAGLLDLYEQRKIQAAAMFMAALDADPGLWQARLMLDRAGL